MIALNIGDTVAVIGAGTMGAGIAQVAASAGHDVILFDISDGVAKKGIDSIKFGLDKLIGRGKKTTEEVNELIRRITPTQHFSDIKESSLVIEAIIEDLDIKQGLIADIEALVADDTIIASNTSSISISALAAKAERPENIVGMHFFNPAIILKLVEIVSGLQTSEATAQRVYDTSIAWQKKPVFAKSTPGFIVNRVARPFYAEALRSINEELASVEVIDKLMRNCGGFKMGPLELTDLIGQDVNSTVTESVYNAFYQDKRFMPSVLQAEMVAAGLLGRKSGRGFYTYPRNTKKDTNINRAKSKKIENVKLTGNLVNAKGLYECVTECGYSVEKNDCRALQIIVGKATIKLSDGRTATQHAVDEGISNLILVDYAKNYQSSNDIALAIGVNTEIQAKNEAIEFFQSLGKDVHVIKDVPGLQVLRTVCMLINEAYDVVNQGVCSSADVDTAMLSGVAYPMGPIAWGKEIGIKQVSKVLKNIQSAYGEERYRVSPLLVKHSHTN